MRNGKNIQTIFMNTFGKILHKLKRVNELNGEANKILIYILPIS